MKDKHPITNNAAIAHEPRLGDAAKLEIIKAAYGEHWETVKDFVSDQGWCNFKKLYGDFGNSKGLSGIQLEVSNPYSSEQCYFKRPTSLSGFENNNGWKPIHSRSDLPATQIPCWIKTPGDVQLAYYVPHKESFGTVDEDLYWSTVSHYQIVEIPNDPVY